MGSFKLGGMTFGSLFKKPETVLYPFEQKPAPAGLKGHIENDASACILCGICAKSCPADAIAVEKKERTWAIDPFRCVQPRGARPRPEGGGDGIVSLTAR